MYRIGMYGGSFNPLHLGHVSNICTSSALCEKLYLVLAVSNDNNEVDYHIRYKWLKNITSDLDNVEVITMFDDGSWENGRDFIVDTIKDKIDVVFAGSDYLDKYIWENLYKDSDIHYFDRNDIPISSTLIRSNPYKYYEYLPNIVKEYYTKKVCIIGTESCGKTQLVRKLAKMYNTTHVEEAGRYVCEEVGGVENMIPDDYFGILFKHKELEHDALKHANKVLIVDTDALITLYYYKLEFDNTPFYNQKFDALASSISNLNDYDLYVFLEPDVKWVQDGTRMSGEESFRNNNNQILKELLKEKGINYEVVNGDYYNRLTKTKKLIDGLFI